MKVIIIGAVASGASAAARLRRLDEHAEIILLEKGNYFSYANCGLPYYIGNVIKERNKLFITDPKIFQDRFNIHLRLRSEAIAIDPKLKTVTVLDHTNGITYTEYYDKLVLSTGSLPVIPPIEGIDRNGIFVVREVNDSDRIKSYLETNKVRHGTIIGAGFIGIEMIENLHNAGLEVSLVERADQILPHLDYAIVARTQTLLQQKGVHLHTGTSVTGFSTTEDNRILVKTGNGDSFETDLVILSIGVRPNASLAAAAGIQLGKHGGILVNEFLETSIRDIYAAGDVIEFKHPVTSETTPTFLAGPANKQGRIVANNIHSSHSSVYTGSVSTAIVKVFDHVLSSTGVNAATLQRNNTPYMQATVYGNSHSGYYPGGTQTLIRLLFSPENGTILGAQLAGEKGIDKRTDVLSSLIQQKGTVHDLADFEQAYAPPFSSAKDPLNMIGFVAENQLSGLNHVFEWDQCESVSHERILLDVRSENEFASGSIPEAVNLPLEQLRSRIHTLSKDEKFAIFCKSGQRSYIARRILSQEGFDVINLAGGYDLWKTCTSGNTQLTVPVV